MSIDAMVTAAWLLTLFALLVVGGTWLQAARRAARLEELLVEILTRYGFEEYQIGAIVNGDAELTIDGGEESV